LIFNQPNSSRAAIVLKFLPKERCISITHNHSPEKFPGNTKTGFHFQDKINLLEAGPAGGAAACKQDN